MKGFKNIQLKLKVDPITIKEPYKPDVKEFADTDEFTHYFRANEELFKEAARPRCLRGSPEEVAKSEDDQPKFMSANKLNRTYKIPGYRIRIIRKGTDNEELTLVKDYYKRTNESNEETINEPDNVKYEELQQQITDILERINNIESFLLQLKR